MAERHRHGFAIVGCGVIAPTHARALQALPGAELLVAVDVDPGRARAFTSQFGGLPETDLDRALARPDVEVVSVCVPSGLHAEVGCRAAAAGKHVLVEKPIDITLEAADRLITSCEQAGVKLAVISQHRFDAGVRRMKDMIASGRLGRLLLGDAMIKWYRTQEYYDSGDWRGTWALDGGGCLMNQGVHYVDLLQWTMGPVERIFARCRTAAHQIDVEDIATAVLSFANGAVGVLEASTAVYPGMGERLEVSGTGGTLIVESGVLRVSELKDYKGETSFYGRKVRIGEQEPESAGGGSADPAAIGGDSHQAEIEDLLQAIEEDRQPLVTGPEARKALEIILGVYQSAERGVEVTLPLSPAAGGGR
ncbi:MAG: Gfo/Idh/MocA family protein [Candidatus Dormibacteraceae bacterium]